MILHLNRKNKKEKRRKKEGKKKEKRRKKEGKEKEIK